MGTRALRPSRGLIETLEQADIQARITVRKFLEAVNLPGTPHRGRELTKLVEAILSDMEQIWIQTQGTGGNVCEVESNLCDGGEIDVDATVELSICLRPAPTRSTGVSDTWSNPELAVVGGTHLPPTVDFILGCRRVRSRGRALCGAIPRSASTSGVAAGNGTADGPRSCSGTDEKGDSHDQHLSA